MNGCSYIYVLSFISLIIACAVYPELAEGSLTCAFRTFLIKPIHFL